MANLTAADRKKIPAKNFAGPDRSFPIENATHAKLAISGASRSENAGNISAAQAARIKAKARAKLRHVGPKKGPLTDAINSAIPEDMED